MNDWLFNIELFDALLKGSVFLMATSLLAILLRHASATTLYRVWFLGFCMAVVVAVASTIAPLGNLAFPIYQTRVANFTQNGMAQESNTSLGGSLEDKPPQGSILIPPSVEELAGRQTEVEKSRRNLRPKAAAINQLNHTDLELISQTRANEVASNALWKKGIEELIALIVKWWAAIWIAGTASILLRTLLRYRSVYKVLRNCNPLKDPILFQSCRDMSQRLVVPTPELLVHGESLTPFVTGLWKPKIVLPAKSSAWSIQKQMFVMLHELAHIKRRDLLTESIARFVVAVYWFNPLGWWGYTQLMRLRELACDDLVLQLEKKPCSYAETLLDIATSYRSQKQALVIGMSGKLDIARRIQWALDGTRARATFSKRTLRCVTCFALVLCLVLGAIQLRSVAVEPQTGTPKPDAAQKEIKPAGNSPKEPAIDEEARSMIIRILDENSQPLSGVDVYVTGVDGERRGGNGNLPRVHYPTDESGETRIKFREGTLMLQLWPSKSGYIPQAVKLDEEKMTLPSEYVFYFEKGTRIAGKIMDTSGNPIENASVQVKTNGNVVLNYRSKQNSPPTGWNPWLAFGDNAVVTNALGEWEIYNAPSAERNPKLEFELLVEHPEFTGDRNWGDYQTRQGITTEQLRDGTATLVMDPGAVLRGKITGPNGEPVTKGLVIFVSNPYFAEGDNEVQIRSDGTYELPSLEPGKYPITVLAPGFAPEQRKVEISQGSPRCDFQLEAGNPIRIEIVDSKGKPIPNALVALDNNYSWRGTSAIYNEKSSGVPDSGIPRRANNNGVYTWDWAPSDGVQYSIGASGYDSKSLTLVAKAAPHRVVLTPPLSISGSVVDALSGEPIPEFKVIPVKAFRPYFYSTDFQENSLVIGKNGKYELSFDTGEDSTERHRVRIEANGYRTAFGTQTLAAGDLPTVEVFKMEPAKSLVGHVATVDGKPVNQFQVAIGTATTSPSFNFDRPETSFGQAFDVDGKSMFEIAASFEPQRIRVFNEDGFVEFVLEPNQDEIGQVVLQPHSMVSGRLMQGSVPIGTEGVYFSPLVQRGLKEARFQDRFYTQTDPDGYFKFDRLPPVVGTIGSHLGPWEDSVMTSSQSIPLDLKPSDRKEVILNGDGIQINGRVVATGRSNDKFSKQWSLNWLVSRAEGLSPGPDASPLSIPFGTGPIDSAWLKHTDFFAWLATKQNYFVKLRNDGRFTIHGVPVGEYDLVVQLFEQPAGCLVEAVGTRVVPITVAVEKANANALDLENIEVACRAGPRPGSDMRAFEYVNSEGQVVQVKDATGRYLVFHFWASWCQPCLATMPELKGDIESLKNASFTAIGFNVDADKNHGRTLAQRLGLGWAQNYLGESSVFARQLAISAVPSYYLIGPDGMLIGSSSEWKEIRSSLLERLNR